MSDQPALPAESNRITKIAATGVFVFILALILGFDLAKDRVGRFYLERTIPQNPTTKSLVQSMGEPEKRCDSSKDCRDFLESFMFSKPIPNHTTFWAYTKHYPMVPILVFYFNESEEVTEYDFGKG